MPRGDSDCTVQGQIIRGPGEVPSVFQHGPKMQASQEASDSRVGHGLANQGKRAVPHLPSLCLPVLRCRLYWTFSRGFGLPKTAMVVIAGISTASDTVELKILIRPSKYSESYMV